MRARLFIIALLLAVAGTTFTVCSASGPSEKAASAATQRQSVLLIILDALRADHLGFYGYKRPTSPVLDQFAREAIAFKHAVSVAPWTPPSVATFFTGLYPTSHGMMPPDGRDLARAEAKKLSSELTTAAELFHANGFVTGGISPNPWITPEFGYSQGYERFHVHLRKNAEFITREGKELITDLQKTGKPFFVSLHYLDPHDPYTPPAPFDSMFGADPIPADFAYPPQMQKFINKYDGEIRYLDTHLADLFTFLKDQKLYDELGIVIVADHGEQFMEHGDHRHGFQLYDEEVHVPLFVKPPRLQKPQVVQHAVSTVDVFPTLLQMGGVTLPQGLPGLPLTELDRIAQRKGVLSEIDRKYHQRAVTSPDGQRLLAGTAERGRQAPENYAELPIALYNAPRDPLARAPIADIKLRDAYAALLTDLMTFAKGMRIGKAESVQIDADTLEQLRTLGYLE